MIYGRDEWLWGIHMDTYGLLEYTYVYILVYASIQMYANMYVHEMLDH